MTGAVLFGSFAGRGEVGAGGAPDVDAATRSSGGASLRDVPEHYFGASFRLEDPATFERVGGDAEGDASRALQVRFPSGVALPSPALPFFCRDTLWSCDGAGHFGAAFRPPVGGYAG